MSDRAATLAIAFAIVAGTALRIAAAQGDLWLDEIWSLRIIQKFVRQFSDIFLATPRDNNHYLNTVWLWLIGPDAPVLLIRSVSLILGAASIAAAAWALLRAGAAASVAAATLFAFSYLFIHYDSEARGYAGMILCVLVASRAFDEIVDPSARRTPSSSSWLAFFCALCAGMFFHLTMIDAAAAFSASALLRGFFSQQERRVALMRALGVCVCAALAVAPALVCFVISMRSPDAHVGDMVAFSFPLLAQGLAGAAGAALGLPEALCAPASVGVASLIALCALSSCAPRRRWFLACAIFGLPLLHAAAHLPSQFYPRFHLVAAIALFLAVSEAIGALWSQGEARRIAAAVLLGLFAIGQTARLVPFFVDGRGDYAGALRWMADHGGARYGVVGPSFNAALVVDFEAARLGVDATLVDAQTSCANPPNWMIAYAPAPAGAPQESFVDAPAQCPRRFALDRSFPAYGLSGFSWSLYRRQD